MATSLSMGAAISSTLKCICPGKTSLDRQLWEATLGGPLPIRHARFFPERHASYHNADAIVNATTLQGAVVQNVPTEQTSNSELPC